MGDKQRKGKADLGKDAGAAQGGVGCERGGYSSPLLPNEGYLHNIYLHPLGPFDPIPHSYLLTLMEGPKLGYFQRWVHYELSELTLIETLKRLCRGLSDCILILYFNSLWG